MSEKKQKTKFLRFFFSGRWFPSFCSRNPFSMLRVTSEELKKKLTQKQNTKNVGTRDHKVHK
uniref:Uncharacterized protein n=1 Tax=Marseillevirus sp. TaxID=2809551 RepID=A0AA96EME4_9VIRU|nr:hypothetical protein MarFTMF_187 [Marseillevirus sp.]